MSSLEYHYLQILIHRPWTSRRLQPSPAQGRGYRHARQICVTSACEMADILTGFERRFGYRRLNVETLQILPSAALILIFATISTSDKKGKDPHVVANLSTVLRALDELSSTHVCAREHLDSLLSLQQSWYDIYKGQQAKRRAGSISQELNDPARRAKRSKALQ